MRDRLGWFSVYLIAWVITFALSAYYMFFRAPAVVDVRPQLADVGLWTALFSGRFMEWLFHTSPLAGAALVFGFWTLFATVVVAMS